VGGASTRNIHEGRHSHQPYSFPFTFIYNPELLETSYPIFSFSFLTQALSRIFFLDNGIDGVSIHSHSFTTQNYSRHHIQKKKIFFVFDNGIVTDFFDNGIDGVGIHSHSFTTQNYSKHQNSLPPFRPSISDPRPSNPTPPDPKPSTRCPQRALLVHTPYTLNYLQRVLKTLNLDP